MMKESEIEDLIAWGKEENQVDFVEFACLFRDRCVDKKNIVVDFEDQRIEGYIDTYNFFYKRPFPDMDFSFWIGAEGKGVILPYTYMKMVKKTGEEEFIVETEKGKKAVISFREA